MEGKTSTRHLSAGTEDFESDLLIRCSLTHRRVGPKPEVRADSTQLGRKACPDGIFSMTVRQKRDLGHYEVSNTILQAPASTSLTRRRWGKRHFRVCRERGPTMDGGPFPVERAED